MTDSFPYSITGLTILAEYHQGNQVWSSSAAAYEAFLPAHYNAGYYAVAATEDGGSGLGSCRYTATTPAGAVAAGAYEIVWRQHVGGTPTTDPVIGSGKSQSPSVTIETS